MVFENSYYTHPGQATSYPQNLESDNHWHSNQNHMNQIYPMLA